MDQNGDGEELAARIRNGDASAFEYLFRQYAQSMYASALSYIGSEIAAEEVVQTIFSRIWDNRETWHPQGSVASYLFAAVRNNSLKLLQHERYAERRQMLAGASEEPVGMSVSNELPDTISENQDIRSEVWRVIETLPERRRAILSLRWKEHLSWEEISQAMQMSIAAVQMQHSRALAQLREKLPKYLGE